MNFIVKVLKTLRTKSWLQTNDRPELAAPSGLRLIPSQLIGLYVFLFVAGSLFMLFTVSYQLRMEYQDWRPAPEPWQLWMNTVFLLGGSVAFQLARNAAYRDDRESLNKFFLAAGVLTWLFIAGQAWSWFLMRGSGYGVEENPANSFFYLITGVHAAHIIGGLVAWHRAAVRIRTDKALEKIQLSIRLCTIYWHFLLLVWLFLFYMLLVT